MLSGTVFSTLDMGKIMRKILNYAAALLLILTPSFVNANFAGPDNTPTHASVVEATSHPSKGSKVILKGHILHKIADQKYHFRDSTGEVAVIITDAMLSGIEISPSTLVEIHGVVEPGRGKKGKYPNMRIKANSIKLAK